MVVLLDQVIDGQLSEDPVGSVDVGLPDSGREHHVHGTIGVDDRLYTVKEKYLLFDIPLDLVDLVTSWHRVGHILQSIDLDSGFFQFAQQLHLLLVGHLFAAVLGNVKRGDNNF